MIVVLYEILIAAAVVAVVFFAWMRSGQSRLGLGLAALVLAVFFLPWIRAADWAAVGQTALVAALVGAIAFGYARLIGRIKAAQRERDGGE